MSGTNARVSQSLAEILIHDASYARVSQIVAEVLTASPPVNGRVSQIVAEVVHTSPPSERRASQITAQSLIFPAASLRASQLIAESLVRGGTMRASQTVTEVLTGGGHMRASQAVAEVLAGGGHLRGSQIAVEILIHLGALYMPAAYPTLIGLTYSVVKRPIWNTGIGTAASGREVRVGLFANPIWEFDLSYDFLPDNAEGTTQSDLKTMMGFFNSTAGALLPFNFTDPDDNAVVGQSIGTGDGATTNFTFVRTYGGADGNSTEPVGNLNLANTLNVYVAGALQPTTAYTVLTSTPVAQQVKFNTAPAAGDAITADFSYFYYVRFKDDKYNFTKFMNQLWSLKKVTLRSVRG
jgi:uncharacterized protein (TIGR02217 family)